MEDARIPRGDRESQLGWRRPALWLLIFAEAGVLLELWLLGHYEDVWQWTPLALLSVGLIASVWIARRTGPASLRTFRRLMAAHVAAGAIGVFFHLQANVEFELELHSDTAGWQLAAETLTGAIPALAPFAMAQLGLLGMLYCWRHPAGTLGNGPG